MILDFKKIFADFIEANKKTWAHDRSQSVGASEVFGCLRHAWFRKFGEGKGFKKDDDAEEDWGATKRGDLLELNFVVPAIRDHLPGSAKLIWAGAQQQTFFHGHNSGTPDGLIINLDRDALKEYGIEDIGPSRCVVFEIKSVDPRVSLHTEKDIHFGQTQTQLGLINEKTDYKPEYGLIFYVDASFLSRIKVFVFKYEPHIWKIAQDRAKEIMTAEKPDVLRAEGHLDGSCQYCHFKKACADVTVGGIPPKLPLKLAKERAAELEPLILEFKELQARKKDAEYLFEHIQMRIKEALQKIGSRNVKSPKAWGVTWYSQKGRQSLDQEAVKEALGVDDLDSFKKEGPAFDVLRVTFTAENDQNPEETD